jgi:hypothetical protein
MHDRREQGSPECIGRVAVGAQRCDGEPEYAPDSAAQTSRRIAPPALFDLLQDEEDFCRRDGSDRPFRQGAGKVHEQPSVLLDGYLGAAFFAQPSQVFPGDRAEGVVGGNRRRHLVELLLHRRVDALGDLLVRFIPLGAGRCERDLRERTEGEHGLLAAEAIAQPPQLAAVGIDQQVQAVAVRELVRLLTRLCILNAERRETYEGTASVVKEQEASFVPSRTLTVTGRHGSQRGSEIRARR